MRTCTCTGTHTHTHTTHALPISTLSLFSADNPLISIPFWPPFQLQMLFVPAPQPRKVCGEASPYVTDEELRLRDRDCLAQGPTYSKSLAEVRHKPGLWTPRLIFLPGFYILCSIPHQSLVLSPPPEDFRGALLSANTRQGTDDALLSTWCLRNGYGAGGP